MKKWALGFLFFAAFTALSSHSSLWADDSTDRKLDQVLKNQAEISKKLDDVMAELQIVKVRASQR